MSAPPTEAMIAEMEALFKLFDKDNDGLVSNTEFGTMLRILGMNPSEEEIATLIQVADPEHTGNFSRDSFFTIATKRGKDPDTIEDLIEAFKILNKDEKGNTMQEALFKQYMTTCSEKMRDKEIDEILNELDIVTTQQGDYQRVVNYEELAKLLLSK